MIVQNQSNIKVHFAGAESLVRSNLILEGSQSHYSLFTIFPFLCDRFGIKHGYQSKGVSYAELAENNSKKSLHCIQDSGLFSLMFGSYKGERDEKFILSWYDGLVSTTLEGNYGGTVVEVDCQKVLGVGKAWELRERMRADLPNNRQINVFHIEDGQKGLERLIEFSDYIAISVPELVSLGKRNYTSDIAHFIKNKKPEIDIHLLGCTANKTLRDLNFCTSSDSTSWVSLNKFGWFKYNDGRKTTTIKKSNISREQLEKVYYERLRVIFAMCRSNATESLLYYHACDLFQLEYLLKQYTVYAGPQD